MKNHACMPWSINSSKFAFWKKHYRRNFFFPYQIRAMVKLHGKQCMSLVVINHMSFVRMTDLWVSIWSEIPTGKLGQSSLLWIGKRIIQSRGVENRDDQHFQSNRICLIKSAISPLKVSNLRNFRDHYMHLLVTQCLA